MLRPARLLTRGLFAFALSLGAAGPASSQVPGLPLPRPSGETAAEPAEDGSAEGSSLQKELGLKKQRAYRFDPNDRSTPRRALVGYLSAARSGDYERAAEFLDLAELPPESRAEAGPDLARRLKFVLDRYLWIDPEALSDDPEGAPDDGQPSGVDLLGNLPLQGSEVRVLVERRGESSETKWLVAAPTVAVIDALYEEHGYPWLDRLLPDFLLTKRILASTLWQWIGLVLLAAAAWVVARFLALALRAPLRRLFALSTSRIDDDVLVAFAPPFRLYLTLLLVGLGSGFLYLSVMAQRRLNFVLGLLAIVAFVWFLLRVIDTISAHAEARYRLEGNRGMLSLVPMLRRGAKIALLLLAATLAAQNYGFNVTALLAGAGVAGLAVAFAAQRTIENLFGGISVILDQSVRVGDFCKVGAFQGTVEDIGLRSTRVRTVDRTIVSVPNAQFSTEFLENFGARDRIRLFQVLNLRYETTPDQLRWLLTEIRKLVYSHPMIAPDQARVRFVNFGPSSLDVEIFCFVRTTDFPTFTAVREDVFLRLMDLVSASGSGFAFPSQTVYFGRDPGVDAARTRAAEAQVEAWRKQGTLPFPDLAEAEIGALEGTLPYPPEGSIGRKE
ncbi:MAG: mechanosensitive ion channel family protein [Acidobacteria bacterium]|nr:mechanosensitive ion channel family protein [Acidobacteriota bacterium]